MREIQVALLVGVLGSACGDDAGGGGGTETETEGTASSSDGAMDTMAAVTTMSNDDTTGGEDMGTDAGTSSDEGGSQGTGDGDTGDTSGEGSSTGAGAECRGLEIADCEMTRGCIWVGNPNNGECIVDDPSVCDGLEQMECNMNPLCEYDNQAGTCGPAGG